MKQLSSFLSVVNTITIDRFRWIIFVTSTKVITWQADPNVKGHVLNYLTDRDNNTPAFTDTHPRQNHEESPGVIE